MSTYAINERWPGQIPWSHRKQRQPHHRHAHHQAFAALREMCGSGPRPEGPRGGHGGPFAGPPAGPFGRHGYGPGPRGRRGRARRGDVRLALLRLLAEEPRNGYQLMQTIEERSGGDWRPSPGSVYPTLAQLEDEGLVRSVEAEGARRFEITDSGREHLETRSEEPAPWDIPEEGGHPMRDTKRLIAALATAAAQVAAVGDESQRAQAIEVLTEARRRLYRILAEDPQE